MASEDGGNAFPAMYPNAHNTGMTLRDWFAGMAIQSAYLAFRDGVAKNGISLIDFAPESVDAAVIAEHAYSIADAMLAARKEAPDGKRD